MDNNYKEKLGEIANEAQNVVSSIATEENKQKVAEVAETTVKKVKSLNKKTLIIIAVAVVAVIAILSSFGGNKAEKAVKQYITEIYNDEVKDIEEIWSDKVKVEEDGITVKADVAIFEVEGETIYYICKVIIIGDNIDITTSVFSEKSDMKKEAKAAKKKAKDGIKLGESAGVIIN